MDKEVKIAQIGAISVIIAATIGGLFTIVPAVIERDKLNNDYEESQVINLELTAQVELNENYISLQNRFDALERDYNLLLHKEDSDKDNESLDGKDQLEVNEIIETLHNFQSNHGNEQFFANILTDIDAVELFYKTQMCMRHYKYSNIIIAFKKCEIECEPLEITEEILELWDIEMIYIFCQMQENLENSEEKRYLLNDYKMESIDQLNYMGYGYLYQDETYEEISKIINDYIDRILKKMKRNSLPVG